MSDPNEPGRTDAAAAVGGGDTPRRSRPSRSARWGMWVARRGWWVLVTWLAVLVVTGPIYPHLVSRLSAPDCRVAASDSQKSTDTVQKDFTAAGAAQDIIVFDSTKLKTTDQERQDAVGRVVKAVRSHEDAVAVVSPYDHGAEARLSKDRRAAFATLGLNGRDRQRAGVRSEEGKAWTTCHTIQCS